MFQTIARRTVASALAVFLLTAVPALACGPLQGPEQGEIPRLEPLQVDPLQVESLQVDLFDHVRTLKGARISTDG